MSRMFNLLLPTQIFRIFRSTTGTITSIFEHLLVLIILGMTRRPSILVPGNMSPSMQQEFFKGYSSSLFPQFPSEIRNYIWKISVTDYPARIVDLREYRRPVSRILSPEPPVTPKSVTESSSCDFQSQRKTDDIREVAGFKSRVPAPTVLYVCRDSSYIAQESHTKVFGNCRHAGRNMD
jgi:2EXR family